MIGALLTIIGLFLSLLGAVLKIDIPIIPGYYNLSVLGLGLFLVIMGMSTFARGLADVVSPFYLLVISLVSGLAIQWFFLTYLKINLFGELLKLVTVNWPH